MQPPALTRRAFLRLGGAATARVAVASSLWAASASALHRRAGADRYGPLLPPDDNGIRLPEGFRSRIVARQGAFVGETGHRWHAAPDGGATFQVPGGYVYVSNSELRSGGGVGAIRFGWRGNIVDAYPICSGTRRNCAGGATPWGTWLSCEEVSDGLVYECDPSGRRAQVVRPALGRFNHEAVAVDPIGRRLYLTEDRRDGRLYRFTPHRWTRLDAGTLEVAQVLPGGAVRWHVVPSPSPAPGQPGTRQQVPVSSAFDGGEGIVHHRGHVYFTTKGDDSVWDYHARSATIRLLYQSRMDPARTLSGVDNVAATRSGQLVVAEDGGNMELVLLDLEGRAAPLLRVEGQPFSELAGPAFDPSGRRLYFSSQRGFLFGGITYEVSGPFERALRRRRRRRSELPEATRRPRAPRRRVADPLDADD